MTTSQWPKEKAGALSISAPPKAGEKGRTLTTAKNVSQPRARLLPCDQTYKVISINLTSRHAVGCANSFS
jgi:hypothetical protein